MSPSKLKDFVVSVGAPLLAIATVALLYKQGPGSLGMFLAAVLAGVAVPFFDRFIAGPFLRAAGTQPTDFTADAFKFVCNLAIGAAAALCNVPA